MLAAVLHRMPTAPPGFRAVLQVQTRLAGSLKERWWQPPLKAMAPMVVPHLPGKYTRKHKREMQNAMMAHHNHARRIEGTKRNRVIWEHKREVARQKMRDVYAHYGALLQEKALKQAAEDKKPPTQ